VVGVGCPCLLGALSSWNAEREYLRRSFDSRGFPVRGAVHQQQTSHDWPPNRQGSEGHRGHRLARIVAEQRSARRPSCTTEAVPEDDASHSSCARSSRFLPPDRCRVPRRKIPTFNMGAEVDHSGRSVAARCRVGTTTFQGAIEAAGPRQHFSTVTPSDSAPMGFVFGT
jgi:hypothetical protein